MNLGREIIAESPYFEHLKSFLMEIEGHDLTFNALKAIASQRR